MKGCGEAGTVGALRRWPMPWPMRWPNAGGLRHAFTPGRIWQALHGAD